MVQAARIAITGTQTMEDGGPQTLELVTDGSYCYEPGFALLSYVESEMTGLEGVVTSFQIEDGKTVTLRRSGKVNAEMVFDRRQAHESLYDVGFGAMMISVVTEDMTVLLKNTGAFSIWTTAWRSSTRFAAGTVTILKFRRYNYKRSICR